MTNISTIVLPIALCMSVLGATFFMKKGKFLQQFHFFVTYNYIISNANYILILWFSYSEDAETTFWVLLLINLFGTFDQQAGNYMFAFNTLVSDKSMGGTSITMLNCIVNLSSSLGNTIGL